MAKERAVGFSRRDASMLIRNAERNDGSLGKHPGNYELEDGPRLALIYSSGGCTARSGTTLGTGTGVVQKIDPSTGVVSNWTSTSGATLTITFKNSSTTALAAGYIQVKREGFSGQWLADVADCA